MKIRIIEVFGTVIALSLQSGQRLHVDAGKKKMSKISSIVDFLEAGIMTEGMRQRAIANNIANLETPGYRRVDIKFTELLAKAMDSSGNVDFNKIIPELYEPRNSPVNTRGNDVNLETEVGQMVKNTLRHKAYVRLLGRKYKQMEAAMTVK